MIDWTERITSDPKICHGKPCIKGTRIMVSVVLGALAESLSFDQVIEEYGSLTRDDILAVLAYAAELAYEEELLPLR